MVKLVSRKAAPRRTEQMRSLIETMMLLRRKGLETLHKVTKPNNEHSLVLSLTGKIKRDQYQQKNTM